ncbi:LPS ABC transporter substrate-binding protein LptA [Mesorhizobium sp. M1A.F.Ca.ET.072.01.1.1]|uniref:LptA/OstA family protein n=1 Tax=unclassified Mesorhizobium TaxID=325217 RepID=UPI000BB08A7C|nr:MULTISPECIES: LptA/OstA family protein [unclassified Mesorhizobium]PBB35546.1 LPS ABC transporter substrate-binding protein LptA [Mesorhizobium sp. WSM3868]RUW47522.1 LPS ABC transporter substrate-binding protein LptA [Mesorhizobium sp. M1A.F.Ca.ET.072.01.1.1]
MRRSSSARLAAAASLFMLLEAAPALAQSGGTSQMSGLKLSGDQPIQIESDKLEVRQADSAAIFSGNVTVNQGPTLLKAGKMTVYYVKDPNAPKGAAAGASAMTGAANIDHLVVENKVYIKSNDQIATGDKGTFDMKTQVLVLSGSEVVLSQGDNVLKGCKLTVQMKSGLANVDGCGTGGRVIMSITPQKQGAPQKGTAQQGASSN